MPVYREVPVVNVAVWHKLHPTLSKSAAPFCVEGVGSAGVGGADKRANIANASTSDMCSPSSASAKSSGEGLKAHPLSADRSDGKTSFDTPCSTLYASPE